MLETQDQLRAPVIVGHAERQSNPARCSESAWGQMNMQFMDELEEITLNQHHLLPAEKEGMERWSAIVSTPLLKHKTLLKVQYICIPVPTGTLEPHLNSATTTRFTGRGYDTWLFEILPTLADMLCAQMLYDYAAPDERTALFTGHMQLRVIARTNEIDSYPPPF